MEKLYAPWRIKYLKDFNKKKDDKCIFCFPDKRFLIHEDKHFLILLNKYPYSNGHIMVAPFIHGVGIEELSKKELSQLMLGVQIGIKIVKRTYKPQGLNIGINVGRIAGAGVEDHLHIHIVPRWSGDTNFMPVIFETKVISESYKDAVKNLKKSLERILNGKI